MPHPAKPVRLLVLRDKQHCYFQNRTLAKPTSLAFFLMRANHRVRAGMDDTNSVRKMVFTPKLVAHCSFAYSALACFRIGMSGSASFHIAKKS